MLNMQHNRAAVPSVRKHCSKEHWEQYLQLHVPKKMGKYMEVWMRKYMEM